jgi:hypothetical protein
MRISIIAVLLLLPMQAFALENTIGNRVIVANRFIETTDLNGLWQDAVARSLANLPAKEQDRVRVALQRAGAERIVERVRAAMVDAMLQTFTADELQSLADFFGSATGRAISKKMPQFNGMLGPAFQDILLDVIKQ